VKLAALLAADGRPPPRRL